MPASAGEKIFDYCNQNCERISSFVGKTIFRTVIKWPVGLLLWNGPILTVFTAAAGAV